MKKENSRENKKERYDVKNVKKNAHDLLIENKELILSLTDPDKNKKLVSENNYKAYASKRNQFAFNLIIEVANKLGITVEGIFEGERIPNPNPYDIDKAFENILDATKEVEKLNIVRTSTTQDTDNKNVEKKKEKDYSYTAYRYRRKLCYAKKNMRVDFLLELCNCWDKSVEDILRGNFEKTAKSKSTKATQEKEAVQKGCTK